MGNRQFGHYGEEFVEAGISITKDKCNEKFPS